jgi:hypothetical protein
MLGKAIDRSGHNARQPLRAILRCVEKLLLAGQAVHEELQQV